MAILPIRIISRLASDGQIVSTDKIRDQLKRQLKYQLNFKKLGVDLANLGASLASNLSRVQPFSRPTFTHVLDVEHLAFALINSSEVFEYQTSDQVFIFIVTHTSKPK
jgi:hypothetical protein